MGLGYVAFIAVFLCLEQLQTVSLLPTALVEDLVKPDGTLKRLTQEAISGRLPIPFRVKGTPRAEDIMAILASLQHKSESFHHDADAAHRGRRQATSEGQSQMDEVVGYKLATFPEDPERRRSLPIKAGDRTCLYFDAMRQLPKHARVHNAVLTVEINCSSSAERDGNTNESALLTSDGHTTRTEFPASRTAVCQGTNSSSDWVHLNVTHILQEWMSQGSGESICLATHRIRLPLHSHHHQRPHLTLVYEQFSTELEPTCSSVMPSFHHSHSTGLLASRTGAPKATCCRLPYFVDFRNTSLKDHIIFPSGYFAYTCSGWCPRRQDQANDSDSQEDLKTIFDKWASSTYRQCKPTAYAPLSIAILEPLPGSEKYIPVIRIHQVENAIVLACGCT